MRTKKILPVALLAAALFGCAARQAPKQYADYSASSGFTAPAADSADVENLVVLGKVWGFAKSTIPFFTMGIATPTTSFSSCCHRSPESTVTNATRC